MTVDDPRRSDTGTTDAPDPVLPEDGPLDPDSDRVESPPGPRRPFPHRRRRSRRRHGDVVAAVGVGGSIGALSRYGLDTAFPVGADRFPWTTLGINLGGCAALGIVLYIVFERRLPSRLLRPFLAIGVLGGFTTFSTFAVEVVQRAPDHTAIAVTYLAASVIGGPLAVLIGSAAMRRLYAGSTDRQREGFS